MAEADGQGRRPATGAEAVLIALKAGGVDYLFANAGTDFPPVIEALAALGPEGCVPHPVTVTHETAAVAMAHGFYLMSGQAQAVMVHVNVGLANAAMGVINAASDNVPMIVMSGRTPLTEHARPGSRVTPIQYGQEMYDQTAIVRDATKFNYELRYAEQGGMLAARAIALAMSEPRAPAYLSLPREPLSEPFPPGHPYPPDPQTPSRLGAADEDDILEAARLIAGAGSPLILSQRSDTEGRSARALAGLAEAFAIPVVEPFPVRNVMASDHPMFLGYDGSGPLAAADVVLVVDSGVPWIEKRQRPDDATTVISLGPDPLFRRMPMRSQRVDLALAGDPAATLARLHAALLDLAPDVEDRREQIARQTAERRRAGEALASQSGDPMTAEWLSRCLSDVLGDDGVVFSELGVVPGAMRLGGPNRFFSAPHSGGLGWAMPAALGAQLHDRTRLTAACIGDGSYIFANPVACHQVAEALDLPILTVVKNNGLWNAVRRSVKNAYPQGKAVAANIMPLTSLEPLPDFPAIARASGAHAERVEHAGDLSQALVRAIEVIRSERRQALIEVAVEVTDKY